MLWHTQAGKCGLASYCILIVLFFYIYIFSIVGILCISFVLQTWYPCYLPKALNLSLENVWIYSIQTKNLSDTPLTLGHLVYL